MVKTGKGVDFVLCHVDTIDGTYQDNLDHAEKTAKAFKELGPNLKGLISVETNVQGQMVEDVRLTVKNEKPVLFFGHTGGIVPTPKEVLEQIIKLNGGDY